MLKFLSIFLLISLPVFAEEQMSYAELERIIRANNVRTVDQLIPLLPLKFRENYTFIYTSRSAQKERTSPDSPRALLYNDKAEFVLTFTRKPGGPGEGKDTIETMQWNPATSGFEMRELVFDGVSDPLRNVETNPQSCLACHGNPPKPNWDTYNGWPGVYGSYSAGGCGGALFGTREARYYQEFLNNGRKAERFRDLPPESTSHNHPGYGDACPDNRIWIGNARPNSDPNADLTQYFHDLNKKRIAGMIRRSPAYNSFKYAVRAIGRSCIRKTNELKEIFPPHLLSDLRATVVGVKNQLELDDRVLMSRYLENQEPPADGSYRLRPSPSMGGHEEEVTMMRELFSLMGIPWENMTLPFNAGKYNFSSPLQGFTEVLAMMDTVEGYSSELYMLKCDELKARSLEALTPGVQCPPENKAMDVTEQPVVVSITEITDEASLTSTIGKLQVCMNCHGNGQAMAGFSLELEPRELLAKSLREDPAKLDLIRDHLRGVRPNGERVTRMPIGAPVFDEATTNSIIEDLRKLSSE